MPPSTRAVAELYLAFNLVYKSRPAVESELFKPRPIFSGGENSFSQAAVTLATATSANDKTLSALTAIITNSGGLSLADTLNNIGAYVSEQTNLLQIQTYPGWYVEDTSVSVFSLIQIAPAYVLYTLDCEATAMTKHLGCYTATAAVSLSPSGLDLATADAHVGGKLSVGGAAEVGGALEVGGDGSLGGNILVKGVSTLKDSVTVGAQEAIDFSGQNRPWNVVTPESEAETTLFGSMSVFGSRSYINGNRVNDAGGKLTFDLVDLREADAPKQGRVTLQSRDVSELTIDAKKLYATGELNVSSYGRFGDHLSVGTAELPAPTTLNGSVTMNGNVTMAGYEELSDDMGNTTVSISLGAIKIYVSTIGSPTLPIHSSLDFSPGSLFINTEGQKLYIKTSNDWRELT